MIASEAVFAHRLIGHDVLAGLANHMADPCFDRTLVVSHVLNTTPRVRS
jgi:hypothetical protein